jgi:hypothetical protein
MPVARSRLGWILVAVYLIAFVWLVGAGIERGVRAIAAGRRSGKGKAKIP